jgi:hypothetical protein
MKRLFVLAAVALVHQASATPPSRPEAATTSFLQAYVPLGAGGIPKRSRMGPLLQLVTPGLQTLLRTASELEEASRCEGPPSIEGDLLWSLAEGAQESNVKTCRIQGVSARCEIKLRYTDRQRQETEEWIDTVKLRRIEGIWLVDDVLTGADWAPKRALRQVLKASIQDNRSCGR